MAAFGEIDWGALLQIIYVAPIAAVLITALFSLMIYGSIRASDARRDGSSGGAVMYGALVALATAGFVAALVSGLGVILNK